MVVSIAYHSFNISAQDQLFLLVRYLQALYTAQVVRRPAVGVVTAVEQARGSQGGDDGFVDLAQTGIEVDVGIVAELGLHTLLATVEHSHVGDNERDIGI